MAEKFSFGEDACLNKPPLFYGMKYDLWCIRMKFFVESLVRKIWNVFTKNYLMPISENDSSETEHLDCIAMNIMVNQVVFNVLKNPNPLKDDEASALLDAAMLVLALFWDSSLL